MAVRYEFCRAAYSAGYRPSSIARSIKRDHTTVFYALNLLAGKKTTMNPLIPPRNTKRNPEPETKLCTKCGQMKPFPEFGFDAKTKTRRRHACRACVAIYSAGYRARNRSANPPSRRGFQSIYFAGGERAIDYTENQQRWAEVAAGVWFGPYSPKGYPGYPLLRTPAAT